MLLLEGVIAEAPGTGYDQETDCLTKDLNGCLASFPLSDQHQSHLRPTKVVEAPFTDARLRMSRASWFERIRYGVHPVLLRLTQP